MPLEREGAVAVLRMEAGKANAFREDFLDMLNALLDELADSDARAAVLIGYERFFSAGLALPELLPLDREAMGAFIARFSEAIVRVFALELPVVAAVNGHAIAGGCVLALQADRRLMADGPYRIGLNEVQLGVALPTCVVETLRVAVPRASLFRIAQLGRLVEPAEALALGLVDEVVPADELQQRAVGLAAGMAELPPAAFAQIKRSLRRDAAQRIDTWTEADRETWLDTWFSDDGQARLTAAVERLKGD